MRYLAKKTIEADEGLEPNGTCWHSSQKITPQPDGGILFEVKVSEPKEVGWWVVQWGSEAEVIEPNNLRQELQEMAERPLMLYGKI